jgi:hypothetical protein
MKNYSLVNIEGCLIDNIKTTSYKKALEYFKGKYEGSYRIYYKENCINVNFK